MGALEEDRRGGVCEGGRERGLAGDADYVERAPVGGGGVDFGYRHVHYRGNWGVGFGL